MEQIRRLLVAGESLAKVTLLIEIPTAVQQGESFPVSVVEAPVQLQRTLVGHTRLLRFAREKMDRAQTAQGCRFPPTRAGLPVEALQASAVATSMV